MSAVGYVVVALVAYLFGSLPSGYLLAKARGLDIRAVGSGNIGATNVFRTLGWSAGALVLVVDAAKGVLPVILARCVWVYFDPGAGPLAIEWAGIIAGFCAVLGHNYTVWLRFKGGKGIATSAGVLAALVPMALLIVLGIFLLALALTRYVSLASICGSAALPLATWVTEGTASLVAVTTIMAVLAIYKHKTNIRRLMSGSENRLGSRRGASRTTGSAQPQQQAGTNDGS